MVDILVRKISRLLLSQTALKECSKQRQRQNGFLSAQEKSVHGWAQILKCKDGRMAIHILLKSLVMVILTHKSRCLECLKGMRCRRKEHVWRGGSLMTGLMWHLYPVWFWWNTWCYDYTEFLLCQLLGWVTSKAERIFLRKTTLVLDCYLWNVRNTKSIDQNRDVGNQLFGKLLNASI